MRLAGYRKSCWDGWRLYFSPAELPPDWWPRIRHRIESPRDVIRSSTHADTMRVHLPTSKGAIVAYLKVYRHEGWWNVIKDVFRSSKALRALRVSLALHVDGFGVPSVLAAGERRCGLFLAGAFLLTLAIDSPTLQALADEWHELPHSEKRRRKTALLRALGMAIGRLHELRYAAGDLLVTNILVQAGPPTRFFFLDHDRSRRVFWFEGERPLRRNLIQLQRIDVSELTRTDQYRFLVAYAQVRGWGRERLRTEARLLALRARRRRAFIARRAARRRSGCVRLW